jgi:hypothetical protein
MKIFPWKGLRPGKAPAWQNEDISLEGIEIWLLLLSLPPLPFVRQNVHTQAIHLPQFRLNK